MHPGGKELPSTTIQKEINISWPKSKAKEFEPCTCMNLQLWLIYIGTRKQWAINHKIRSLYVAESRCRSMHDETEKN